MVDMDALLRRLICLLRCCSLPVFLSISSIMAVDILSRISPAAALVNVTMRSLSISILSFNIIRMIRPTSTAVLPEPAAADIKRLLPPASMAACCSSVQFIIAAHPVSLFYVALIISYVKKTIPKPYLDFGTIIINLFLYYVCFYNIKFR